MRRENGFSGAARTSLPTPRFPGCPSQSCDSREDTDLPEPRLPLVDDGDDHTRLSEHCKLYGKYMGPSSLGLKDQFPLFARELLYSPSVSAGSSRHLLTGLPLGMTGVLAE